MSDIVERLRERTALRYMGNCKCGSCQLVPRPDLDEAAAEITALRAALSAMRQERDEALRRCETVETPEQMAEKFIQAAIDRAPEQLRRLGQFLANVLDEDQWKTADRLLAGAAVALAEREAALSAKDEEVKRLRDALGPFGFAYSDAIDTLGGTSQTLAVVEAVAKYHLPGGAFQRAHDALSPRTAAMEHIAQELAEEIEEETR